jgi:hypothetical protein
LYTGNVLPLTPLYNDTAPYYAEAVSETTNCASARVPANYTVNNCVIDGYCPSFEAGSIGSSTTPAPEAACRTFNSGLIGLANYQAACKVFYPGKIGLENYQAACVSYDAGHIGRSQ